MIKRTYGEKIFAFFNFIFLTLLTLVCIYPFMYVLLSSISEPSRLIKFQGLLLKPLGVTFKGYELVFSNKNILVGYGNTFFYVIVGTLVNLIMSSLGAYVLSRRNIKLKGPLMAMVVITMFFSGGLIPFYFTISKLGLMDNRWVLILPVAISTWNMLILRTGFMQIPKSLEEAAKLDGANEFYILFKIVLPLSKAVLAVITLYYAVGHWNSWFNASIFIKDRSKYPLQLILREILIQNQNESMIADLQMQEIDMYTELVQYCTIIVATVPVLLFYPFVQKHFVKGVMLGSIKG